MKLYISGDMEGVAGVCTWEQVDARTPHPEYSIYRRYYTQEIAAAIDAHGPMRNLLFDELPSDIRVIFGNRKPFSMVQDASADFDGAFFIGYHGAIGDANAVLCHTYTPSVIYEARLNGIRCSEATLNAAVLGARGVPLLLITGDRTTIEGVQAQMPWVRGCIVKESIGNFAADSVTPTAAQRMIRDGAREAIARAQGARPFIGTPPFTLDLTLGKTEQADVVEMIPGFARTGGRSIRFVHNDIETIFKAFVATFRLGATVS
jgi:D-amino peptidase